MKHKILPLLVTLFILGCSNDEIEEQIQKFTIEITTSNGGSVSSVGGSFKEGSSFSVTATPNNGFSFVQWSNGSTSNPLELTVNSNQTIQAVFEEEVLYTIITKENVDYLNIDSANPLIILDSLINTSINDKLIIPPYPVSERLNYIGSEHFMVWWDKDFDHLRLAVSQLKWAEKTWISSIDEVGFSPLDFTDNEYINIILKTNIYWMDAYNSYDVFYENYQEWGTPITANYAGGDYYGKVTVFMPATPHPEPTLSRLGDLTFSINNIVHETFHALTSQSYNPNYKDYIWLVESTADWMEIRLSEYLPNDGANWYSKVPCFTLNPHRALWFGASTNYNSENFKTEIIHPYGASILWDYLERNQILETSDISEIYSSSPYTSPQETLYRTIENFETLYLEFALKNSTYDFPEPARQIILEWRKSYRGEGSWGVEVGSDLGLNEYKSIINEQDNLSSEYEIEPWAYNIFKINKSSTSRTLNLNFQGSENGEYGTDSNFRLGISSEEDGEFEYFYPNLDNNLLENYSLNLDSNKEYFIVVLSFPEVFDGDEKFNYQIEINISEN